MMAKLIMTMSCAANESALLRKVHLSSAQRHPLGGTGLNMRAAISVLYLTLLAGCASTVAPQGIEGPVQLGQVAYVSGPRVRPDRLIEDSRCPIATQCIWAGRVVLRATVLGGGWSRQVDLTLGKPFPIADGTLTLISVEPERSSGKQEPQQQLRFMFAFRGALNGCLRLLATNLQRRAFIARGIVR